MKLEAGKWYKTRDGRKAFVGFQNPFSKVWVGYIEGEPLQRVWSPDGKWNSPNEYCLDLISEWIDAPAVGSSAWANSLPVGSKVRFKEWAKDWHVTRTADGWTRSTEIIAFPGQYSESPSGWLLYTEPKLRPWKPEEVPVGAWMREKNGGLPSLIVAVTGRTLHRGHGDSIQFDYALNHYEHSTDNGVTWKPCGIES